MHWSTPSRRFPSLLIGGLLCALGAVACGEAGDGLVDEATVALELLDIDVDTECDSPTNPGDFYITAEISDFTAPGRRRIGRVNRALTQSHVGVTDVDILLAGSLRQEPGRVLELDVRYEEYDGGTETDGTASQSVLFAWDEAKRCWRHDMTGDVCVAPGESMSFDLPLDDPSGKCEASLAWTFEPDTARVTVAEAHAGDWTGGDYPDLTIVETDTGDAASCLVGYVEAFVDPEAEVEFAGVGLCERIEFAGGSYIPLTFEGRWVSDTEVRGTLIADVGGASYEMPFEGTRDLRVLAITVSEVLENPSGGSDLHWFGTIEMRR